MNKFAIIALFALMGCALCNPINENVPSLDKCPGEAFSELAEGGPASENESKYLEGEEQIFSEYCGISRDIVTKFVKEKANGMASTFFQIIFDSAQKVSMEAIKAAQEEQEKQSIQIEDKEVLKAVEAATEEEQQQQQGLIGRVVTAVKNTFMIIVQTLAGSLIAELKDWQKELNDPAKLKDGVEEACSLIQFELKGKLENSFRDYKKQLLAGDSSQRDLLNKYSLRNLKCLTSSRAQKLITSCSILSAVGSAIWPALGVAN